MRRAQSVRNYARPSLALGADDLGILREGNESTEDVLRRQLLDKDRENDRLQAQIQALQDQLAQRPPLEKVQDLVKEHKHLELLYQGTQRENERCMGELERTKAREKLLERGLTQIAGENWQASLDIPPSANTTRSVILHQRSNTLSSSPLIMPSPISYPSPSLLTADDASTPTSEEQRQQQQHATLAHVEQVRMLILGMEQRLQAREEKLAKGIERAETEGRRFEDLRKEITAATS